MDDAKYNLRCNRSISGKMLKKDFVYDTKVQQLGIKKSPGEKYRASSFQIQHNSIHQLSRYILKATEEEQPLSQTVMQREPRVLNFECNFCHEPVATLTSLSTHVKSHFRKYCKSCYWILLEDETIEMHVKQMHPLVEKNET